MGEAYSVAGRRGAFMSDAGSPWWKRLLWKFRILKRPASSPLDLEDLRKLFLELKKLRLKRGVRDEH